MTIAAGGAGEDSNRPIIFPPSARLGFRRLEGFEGYREGLRVETPKAPLGQEALEGEGHGSGPSFLSFLSFVLCLFEEKKERRFSFVFLCFSLCLYLFLCWDRI